MMFRIRYNHKNKRKCVPCVPSCVPLSNNGTHTQPLPHKALAHHVYHVYHCARARIRENFSHPLYFIHLHSTQPDEKLPRVRDIVLMVHMVHISLKALCSKAFQCVPFMANGTQKSTMVHIGFEHIDFKKFFMCTIVAGCF